MVFADAEDIQPCLVRELDARWDEYDDADERDEPRLLAEIEALKERRAGLTEAPETLNPDSFSTSEGTIGTTRPKPSASMTRVIRMKRTDARRLLICRTKSPRNEQNRSKPRRQTRLSCR